MNTNIEINKTELAHIREYLTAERRGDAFSADAGDTIREICRRVGFAALDTEIFPATVGTPGICAVCGCTEKDPCTDIEPCAWEPGFNKTICTRCADA